jgi:hypothetical protein
MDQAGSECGGDRAGTDSIGLNLFIGGCMSKSPSTPFLDMEMLNTYEERLRAQGLPVDRWLKPGLTDREMDETLEPLGLSLPAEGRVWWRWHGGETSEGRDKVIGPWKSFLSLVESVEVYREFRSMAEGLVVPDLPPLDDPDFRWNPAWLPISGPQHPCVIDCSVPGGEPTPVRFIDWQNVDGFFLPRAESFGQMVSWWIDAIDCGAWRWDPARNRWDTHDDLLDRELRANPLM